MRLLQVVHGFPPRENAGTERYAAMIAVGLRRRGWEVHTFAATLMPGAPMYRVLEEPGVTRIVNNAPYAALRNGATDPAIDRAFGGVCDRFRPDRIHIHHVHALSTTLPLPVPATWTLHDAGAWCAAGGLLLRDGAVCAGPGPACAVCASAWVRDPPAVDRALRVAGVAGRVIAPDVLHRAWRQVPERVREAITAGAAPLTPEQVDRRTAAFRALAARTLLVAPSRWLADAAEAQGLGPVRLIPQAVDVPATPRTAGPDAPFVFLGTLARHKGPHLVRAAWERAGVSAGLRIHGPPGPGFSLPNDGPVAWSEVPALLAGARALVLGSVWPEPAPLVVLEARAAGCPVIAPAIGGLPEMVDGWFYPPGDVDALAATMREAMGPAPLVRPPPSFEAHLDALVER